MNPKPTTTITASSIPTKDSPWYSVRQEVRREIMNTDILCEIAYPDGQELEAVAGLEAVFAMMRDFEQRYSRFRETSELCEFNRKSEMTLSPEFFDMLSLALHFHRYTDGLFDPSILPALEKEGYLGAPHEAVAGDRRFDELRLDTATLSAAKPRDLLIDLGGIGKGYIVDQVAAFLGTRFEHFLIDAGGDIFAKGRNQKEGTPWAIEVEHPEPGKDSPALLLLENMAVATSGRNRRRWTKDGQEKHHLIDPMSKESAQTDFLSVTVIAPSTVAADVFAKTLFIAGRERGLALAEQWALPAIFIESSGNAIINRHAEPYVWKP